MLLMRKRGQERIKMETEKIKCLVLDAVEEDFHPIWEIFSVLKNNLDIQYEDQILDFLIDSLNYLLKSKLVAVYGGYSFGSEQKKIDNFVLDRVFALSHLQDWQNTEYKGIDYRFAITNRGEDFLINYCKLEYFNRNP